MNPLDKAAINWNMPNAASKRRLEAQLVKRRESRNRDGIPLPGNPSEKLNEADIDQILQAARRTREKDAWARFVEEQSAQ